MNIYRNQGDKMVNIILRVFLAFVLALLFAASIQLVGCFVLHGHNVHDITTCDIPKFVEKDFTQLEKISEISRLRSAIGHDYSDGFESYRSMKHYYAPYEKYRINNDVEIYSPVDGTIHSIIKEQHGASEGLFNKQVRIQSSKYPLFIFVIFHVDLVASEISEGKRLHAGELIGHARMYYPDINEYGYSFDIAIWNNSSSKMRYVSYFDTMTDSLFSYYVARGARSRNDFIIGKAERDADPLSCENGRFTGNGKLINWLVLK